MEHTNIRPFGVAPDGTPVEIITLSNNTLCCEILTFGATVRSLWVPAPTGKAVDVVLGYDNVESYCRYGGYLGATVGRFANRIAGSRFCLNGQIYNVTPNEGENHLHGGRPGFSHRLWQVEELSRDSVTLSILSPHGEEGYPGTLKATAQFRLEGSALILRHRASCDQDTICSLTNHSYFNLAGHDSGVALDQSVQIFGSHFTPIDEKSIPLGILAPVADTPMDLRTPGPIDNPERRNAAALVRCGGFDHNFSLDGPMGTLHPAALAHSDITGITMAVETTLPGIQFYTGNFIHPKTPGKGGCTYSTWHGYCLETQFFPDSPNQPEFIPPILRAGEIYDHTTVFRFS